MPRQKHSPRGHHKHQQQQQQQQQQQSQSTGSTTAKKTNHHDDMFIENLTLGLYKTLAEVPRICNVQAEKHPPCEKSQLLTWEQRHNVYLPEEMKKFYLSTDGFSMKWSYDYGTSNIRRVGYIHIPQLLQITLLRENVEMGNNSAYGTAMEKVVGAVLSSAATATATATATKTKTSAAGCASASTQPVQAAAASSSSSLSATDLWGHARPVLTARTKIFEIKNVNNVAKVCMLYESSGTSNPKFYLLELQGFKWQFLADTFNEYLRMAIAHLGLPYWELCFSNCGLPPWAEQLFMLLAPHLLEAREQRRSRQVAHQPEHPHNVLDLNIFRAKPKQSTKTSVPPPGKHK